MKNLLIDIAVLAVLLGIVAGVWYAAGRITASNAPTPLAIVDYTCAQGKTVHAAYFQGESKPVEPGQPPIPGGSVELSLGDGRNLKLPQTISADGIRYANGDDSFVFWSKGTGAFIMENGTTTYADCAQ